MNWLQQAVLDSRHDEPARRACDAFFHCPGLCVRAWAFCRVCSFCVLLYVENSRKALLSGLP